MKRVTGIGGIFFKCEDPNAIKDWYKKHLGIDTDQWGTNFEWRQGADATKKDSAQWSTVSGKSTHFDGAVLINYRVENLEN